MTPRRSSPRATASSPGAGFLALCALSGAAGLVYEIVWLRLLTLWLGHGTAATGTLLAAFMGGLAGGAWLGGRAAERGPVRRALIGYGVLEAGVAVYALTLPAAMSLVHPVLRGPYADGDGGALFVLLRIVIAFAFLAPPAMAMGATYPLAVRWFTGADDAAAGTPERPAHLSAARGGRVYAANTLGAALGVALGGFLLMPMLGSARAAGVAVAMSLTASGAALWMARRRVLPPEFATGAQGPSLALPAFSVARAPLAAAAVAVSGFVALLYEVAWTRILTMVLGPTAYAFSGMLLASISGVALGASCGSWLVGRVAHPGRWLGGALLLAAVAALGASSAVDRFPLMMAAAAVAPDADFTSMLRMQIGVGVAVQLPISIALGAAFTFALAHAVPGTASGGATRPAAAIYAANTAGAIVGALATSFALIPWLGLQTTVRLGIVLTTMAGALVCLATTATRARLASVAVAVVAIGAVVLLPDWNREFLANGAYRYAPTLGEGDIGTGLEAGRLLFYREGAAGTVSVRELPGVRSLAIDGKVDASNAEDMLTQKLLAHLPLLLHPNPRDVLVVGLGSGVTAGAALRHPVSRVDVVEISPDVAEASDAFEFENRRVLADPRTRLIIGDGRSHLLLGERRYDVIISEPSNPWMAGVATLFTREFFQAVRGRLTQGGVFCQWAHTYNIASGDLRSIVATFLETFPSGGAWLVGDNDLLLVASTSPMTALDDGVAEAWHRPGVAADLASVDVHEPYSLLTLFVAEGPDLLRYAGDAAIQTDGALSLEYSAPRAVYGRFQESNVAALGAVAAQASRPAAVARAAATVTAAEHLHRGLMRLRADAVSSAYDDFAVSVRLQPDVPEVLDGLVRASVRANRLDDAVRLLREIATTVERAPVLVALSKVLAFDRQLEEATNVARRAVLVSFGDPASFHQLASLYADVGDAAALEQVMRIVGDSAAHRWVTLYCAARLAIVKGDSRRAADAAGQLAGVRPGDVEAWTLLGTARAALDDTAGAREAFVRALVIAPRTVVVLDALGWLELRSGDARAAAERFSDALFLQPTRRSALEGLAQAHEASGDTRRADTVRRTLAMMPLSAR